jgi:Putative zinc-finger
MSTTHGSNGGWHAEGAAIQRWVDGTAGPLLGASVEQHLLRCPDCRTQVAPRVEAPPLEAVWDRVLEAVEVPRAGVVQRLLRRLGADPSDALLVASAPMLRAAWLGGLTFALLFVAAAALATGDQGVGLFLLLAPLVPVAGVAASYGPSTDPTHDITVASPYPTLRLVLLRTAAVLATSAPLAVVVGALLPVPTAVAVAWLVPAGCFVAVVLTASTWVDPVPAGVAVALVWVVLAARALRAGAPLDLVDPTALAVHAAVAVAAVLVLLVRIHQPAAAWRLR